MHAWLMLSALLVGCVIAPLDASGRRCPCGAGWVCDTVRDQCVPPNANASDAGPLDGAPLHDAGIADAADAGIDAPLAPDAWVPAFTSGVAVDMLNTTFDEQDPTLTEDDLEIVFTSDRTGNQDLWTSRRTSTSAAWAAPTRIVELVSTSVETDPEISRDGLHLFFTSLRTGDQDVWEATRASRSLAWGAPTRVVSLSSADEDCCPVASGDGRAVVFASSRGGAGMDLFVASASTLAGPWSGITPLTALNTSRADSNPCWAVEERWLFFDSDRAGGQGGRDVYLSMRSSAGETFSTVVAVPDLSGPFDDRDIWVAPAGDHVWYANDSTGSYDLYVAARR